MSKKNKKNQKKVHAKINNTPVKAEGTKKEESKVPTENELKAASVKELKSIIATAKKNSNKELVKAAKKAKEDKKYAASKARVEARNAHKKSIMDKLIDSKKMESSEPIKVTLEQRKERQENRRKIAYNRYISSIKRRCKRTNLTDEQANAIVEKAKDLWDAAKAYDLVIVYESSPKKKEEMEKIVKDANITSACITGSTAFLKNVPKAAVDKLRELLTGDTVYQYAVDKEDLLKLYQKKHTPKKPSGNKNPHSRPCSKSRSVNFYNLRRLKKATKEAMEKNTHEFRHGSKADGRKARRIAAKAAKPVNKKPTQIKDIKQKSNKLAA